MSRQSQKGDRAPDWVADGDLMSAFGLDDAHCTTSDESNGQAAAQLLGRGAGRAATSVQKQEATTNAMQGRGAASKGSGQQIDEPVASHNQAGFIDNDDGANIRTRPAESSGSTKLTAAPLPPATRVFISGHHPETTDWWYVTAFLPDAIVRGYVQALRITTDLPEPTARLYQIKPNDTAEGLAAREFSSAARDGHDLRYYENVLLFVNRQHGRAGVRGSYQSPGLLGGGANNVQLEAGRRIWLVSAAYARALEGVVPDGSLTNGAVAKVKRFAGHVEDLIASVTQFPRHIPEVAGEYGQAIHDHAAQIIGILAGFLMAEAASMALAATPGGQLPAIIIQLALAAFGAHGMAVAGVQALEHAGRWLHLAWTASGREEQIAAASKELVKMLVSVAMAALAFMGVKGNLGKAAAIAGSMPAMMPALAIAGGGQVGGARAGTAVAAGVPEPFGPFGTAMAMSTKGDSGESEHSPKSTAGSSRADALLTPSEVDAAVGNAKASGLLSGDMRVLEKLVADAKAGQPGALGELEAIRRWIREGKAVEVMPEHQNAGLKNPDYRVNGKLTEVKSRSDALSGRWIKDRIAEANDQIKGSGLNETGVAELQLRGQEAALTTLEQIERQVLGTFKSTTARSLDGVAVYKDGVLFAEWRRAPDGTVVRVVTPPGAP